MLTPVYVCLLAYASCIYELLVGLLLSSLTHCKFFTFIDVSNPPPTRVFNLFILYNYYLLPDILASICLLCVCARACVSLSDYYQCTLTYFDVPLVELIVCLLCLFVVVSLMIVNMLFIHSPGVTTACLSVLSLVSIQYRTVCL